MAVQDGNLSNTSMVTSVSPVSDDVSPVSSFSPTSEHFSLAESPVHLALLFLYSTILLLGVVSVTHMTRNFKSSRSVVTIAVVNVTIAHSLLLATVPFRLYYYANGHWRLSPVLCKVVSGMIHVHMYLTFLFYAVILVLRIHAFHRQGSRVQFYRNMHAVLASLAVWIVSVVVLPCVLHFSYGHTLKDRSQKCFHFGGRVEETAVKATNYVISAVICVVSCLLMALQLHILYLLTRKRDKESFSQQQFNAQVKSLLFTILMMVCFVPYQLFRLYYLEHLDREHVNEVFLTLTALSCVDTLVFKGRELCQRCVCACV